MTLKLLVVSTIFIITLLSKCTAVKETSLLLNWPSVMVPPFTPFSNDYCELNLDAIPAYAKYLKTNGISAVLLTGTTGEGVSLNLKERMEVSKAWVLAAKPLKMFVVVVVGAGLSSTDNFKLVQYLEVIKVDAIMVLPYLYYKANTAEKAVSDLKQISEYAPETPILYYDNPKRTSVYLDMVEFYALATTRIQRFIGIKCSLETAINITAFKSLKKNDRLIIMNYQSIEGASKLGFDTTTNDLSNLFPKLVLGIEDSIGTNRAANYQDRLNLYYRTIVPSSEMALPALKAALSVQTCIDLGGTRPPLYPITDELKKNVTRKLKELGIETACPVY